MADPMTLSFAAIGAVALTEGIKFLERKRLLYDLQASALSSPLSVVRRPSWVPFTPSMRWDAGGRESMPI